MSMEHDGEKHCLEMLVDIVRRMSETFELAPLLQSIEQAGRAVLGCERATVFLYDPRRDELYSKVATGTGEIRFSASKGIAGQAVTTRSVIIVPDAYADPRFNPEIDRQTGYRTRNLLTLPLLTPEGDAIGALQVLNKISGPFTDQDETLAGALGSLTGVAVKRQMLLDEAAIKQRLEHDLSVARDIQLRLLPKSDPVLPGFDIAGWNRPADETGGDCYDFRVMDADSLSFMIADATGHGIGPALIVAQCRALIRAVTEASDDLSFVAGRVNDLLCDDLPDDRFVTVAFGAVHAASGRLEYVSAGHGPMLIYRAAEDRVETVDATGLPMGILESATIQLGPPLELAPGDLFVLLTDGFTEWARGDGELYGDERLCELIRRHHQLPCAKLIGHLYADVLRFAEGTSQLDDLTVILIKRTG